MFINLLNEKGVDLKNKWKFDNVTNQIGAAGTQAYPIDVEHYLSELGYSGDKKIIFRTINNGSNYNLNNNFCNNAKFENQKLKLFSPVSYACRTSEFRVQYDKIKKVEKSANASTKPLSPTGNIPSSNTKPPIDLMKRIIMKTLSEEYYFKKLEETSPMIYSSLKEKFKYFHPAFHSMTPEGLNSRLTFLQQCLRPGNTIPVKGISDNSDINARNTTFGPPPVCVLRVGDFYNSKVIIKDLQISFEQNLWDMNPEGIGIQPMIADVTLQLSFLGGHGLEKPVERLQNALSSNFFANTEMYDERSETTNTTIGGVDTKKFTKEFIQSLNDLIVPPTGLKDSDGKGITQGQHIGLFVSSTVNGGPEVKSINYKYLVNDLFKQTESYFSSYPEMYNVILTTYGSSLTNLLINKDYRVVKKYNAGTTIGNIDFFGLYKSPNDLTTYLERTIDLILIYITREYNDDKTYLLKMLNIDNKVPDELKDYFSTTIDNFITNNLPDKLNTMLEVPSIKKFTTNRDTLIKTLDKLKFILDNGYDVKIDNGKTYKSTFTSPVSFYSEIKPCIDYIKDNTKKMYDKLDTSINFNELLTNPQFNDRLIQDIIITIFYSDKEKLYNTLKNGLSADYQKNVLEEVNKKLIEVFYKTKEVKIKFQKSPKPKNDNDITYIINNEILDTTTDEIKEIFSGNIKIENKLT
jgi:F0F1-type ATP synthase delta subunit